MMLAKFRQLYPQGSLVSELIDIDRGTYIVKVSAIVDQITLATGLAGRDTVETAEDAARERAIAPLILDSQNTAVINLTTRESQPQTNFQSESLPIAEETKEKNISFGGKDDTVLDFANNKKIESVSMNFNPEDKPESSSFVAQARLESETQPKTISAPENPSPELSNDTSANLFAGTFNPDSVATNFSESEENSLEISPTSKKSKLAEENHLEEVNFSEIKHKTDLEIKRLGWTKNDGKEFLKSHYGKVSRLHLTDRQLLEFLQYLESQPNPS